MSNKVYTAEELARLCRVHVSTVRRWISTGKVAAIRLPGGYYRIESSEVDRIRRPEIRQPKAGINTTSLIGLPSGLNQAYILRLEIGERGNPTRDVVLMLGFGLVEGSASIELWDVDGLLMSAEYTPLRIRGDGAASSGRSTPKGRHPD